MESTAFNRDSFYKAAWSTLHSITMHGIHCIPSGCFGPCCIQSTALNRDALGLTAYNRDPLHHNAWNHLHSMTLHGIHCIQSRCILPGCMESMHSSRCMDSTAYNRDPLRHNAWNPLHSIRMLWAMLHKIHCIQSCSIKSTAFNQAA